MSDQHNNADERAEGQNPTTNDERIAARSTESVPSAEEARKQTNNGEHKINWTKWSALGGWTYTIITAGILIMGLCSLHISQKSFVATERAFINFDPIRPQIASPDIAGKPQVLQIAFFADNSGATPTNKLRTQILCHKEGPPTQPADPFTFFKWDDSVAIPLVIGPKQLVPVGHCEVDTDTLLNMNMGIVHLYLMGEARYEDFVDPGMPHYTQFCWELYITNFDAVHMEKMAWSYGVRGRHNCADDDCQNPTGGVGAAGHPAWQTY